MYLIKVLQMVNLYLVRVLVLVTRQGSHSQTHMYFHSLGSP